MEEGVWSGWLGEQYKKGAGGLGTDKQTPKKKQRLFYLSFLHKRQR
jgi:hypothetical protein